MSIVLASLDRLIRDESGQDLVEYAILATIIAIAGVLVLPSIGPKMGGLFSQWGLQVYGAWMPDAPIP